MSDLHDLLQTEFFRSCQTDHVSYQDCRDPFSHVPSCFVYSQKCHDFKFPVQTVKMTCISVILCRSILDTTVSPHSWPMTESLKKWGSSHLTADISSKISLC